LLLSMIMLICGFSGWEQADCSRHIQVELLGS
jgi:hypothetical protein